MIFDDYLATIGCDSREAELLSLFCKDANKTRDEITDAINSLVASEGRFADKVMYHNIETVAKKLQPDGGEDYEALFYGIFSDAVWVYIERADIFEQCVSMLIAEDTALWNSWDKPEVDQDYNRVVAYNRKALRNYFVYFSSERRKWRAFFSRFNITPTEITYEEAVVRHPEYMIQLLSGLNIETKVTPERRIAKIGTSLNDLYAQIMRNQFLDDLANARAPLWADYDKL